MGRRFRFFRTTIGQLAVAGLSVGLGLGICAGVLFLRDRDDFAGGRRARLRSIQAERTKVQSALTDVHQRMASITVETAKEQERIRQTAGIIAQLKELDSTWDKLTGDAQQQANSERRAKLEQQQADSTARVAALQTDYVRTGWERDGLEIELGRLESQLKTTEGQSVAGHYLRRAWNLQIGGMKVKGWMGVLLTLYLCGLTAHSIVTKPPADGPPGARQ